MKKITIKVTQDQLDKLTAVLQESMQQWNDHTKESEELYLLLHNSIYDKVDVLPPEFWKED